MQYGRFGPRDGPEQPGGGGVGEWDVSAAAVAAAADAAAPPPVKCSSYCCDG